MISQTLIGIATSTIRLATPYLYAAIGETIGQLSGILNLGVDGIMLMGAFASFFITLLSGHPTYGLLAAVGCGAIMGLLMAFVSVTLQAEQGISGIGLYLVGLGLSTFLFGSTVGTVKSVKGFSQIPIPGLERIPIIGDIFFRHNPLVYGAFALVPLTWFLLKRTPLGLKLRAAGQNPQAADSLGVNIFRLRYFAVITGGILSGIAGASLSIALLNIFQPNLTNGMGFIAVALVYFGGWRPLGVLTGAILFSGINAIQLWLQVQGAKIPADFALMMPYIAVIIVLASLARRRIHIPAALNKPFEREG